jgi:predicted ATP-dependent endonuclease of OLD family
VINFRSIKDATLLCDDLTALIGPNGSGKSSFLRALEMFYEPNASYTVDDFFNRDTENNISIIVTYKDLSKLELRLFRNYKRGDELTVEKIHEYPSTKANQKYYGSRLQNNDFEAYRNAFGRSELSREYNLIQEKYPDLPNYSNKPNALNDLMAWEEQHPEQCIQKRDDGQFFGFKEVGKSNLEKFTKFILIPAVRNASDDAIERKGSALTEILDLLIRNMLETREEIVNLRKETQNKYNEVMNPIQQEELLELEILLSNTLETYVTDTKIELNWSEANTIEIPLPTADIGIVEEEFSTPIENTGHGLQRAFILTMLQHLTAIQSLKLTDSSEDNESEDLVTNVIIGIEEPELYQHPNRQRHLAKVFFQLATGTIEGLADRTQIIYSTHSPLFVDIKRFKQIRRLRKELTDRASPKETKVISTSLDKIAHIIEIADGQPEGTYTGETLEPRLQTLMTPWMNEGFFADVVVLVEGEEDRAAILGAAIAMERDFESIGISVIPCLGKNNIDRPTAIFKELGIPVYILWDGDFEKRESNAETNRRLLRLMNYDPIDWPDLVTPNFACFKKDLKTKISSEIGEDLFVQILSSLCTKYSFTKHKDACKNPQIMKEIILESKKLGKSSTTLETMIENICNLV